MHGTSALGIFAGGSSGALRPRSQPSPSSASPAPRPPRRSPRSAQGMIEIAHHANRTAGCRHVRRAAHVDVMRRRRCASAIRAPRHQRGSRRDWTTLDAGALPFGTQQRRGALRLASLALFPRSPPCSQPSTRAGRRIGDPDIGATPRISHGILPIRIVGPFCGCSHSRASNAYN